MPRRHILMLWIVLVSESALAQHPSSLFFACGNKEHTPPHSAKDLDEAKAMTKRLGCRAWKVHTPSLGIIGGGAMRIPQPGYSAKLRLLESQQDELNKWSEQLAGRTAWQQLRSDNIAEQGFRIEVTSTPRGGKVVRYRIVLSGRQGDPPNLHGYVTFAADRGGGFLDDSPTFSELERFETVQRNFRDGTVTYEFDDTRPSPSGSKPTPPQPGSSHFILSDAPLDTDDASPTRIYWFYLTQFTNP